MNNFFYKSSEYSLFRKALRDTNGEPVLINILSTDPSLNEDKQETVQPQRKSQSSKFEPTTPFGKFFGARKATRTTPVDMKDFSSWKNKNYRKVEQSINAESESTAPKFSLTDYMNKTMGENKFNDADQVKNDTQKPINELSTEDPLYKRFSLDSYLHKLEEQNKAKDKFNANDDLLEPLGDVSQDVVPDSSQDEDFGLTSDVNVEGVAFDEDISGEKFSFDQSELDKVKSRLEKMEREAANIKDKPTAKVINSNELTDIAHDGEPDELDVDKLLGEGSSEDDIDRVNKKMEGLEGQETDAQETVQETPKVTHKTFIEINRTPGTETSVLSESDNDSDIAESNSDDEFDKLMREIDAELDAEEDLEESVSEEDGENVSGETSGVAGRKTGKIIGADSDFDKLQEDEFDEDELDEESDIDGRISHINTAKAGTDFVTKDDLKSMSEDLLEKFTELYKKDTEPNYGGDVNVNYVDGAQNPQGQQTGNVGSPTESIVTGQPYTGQTVSQTSQISASGDDAQVDPYTGQPIDPNNHLQTRILEMIEENKKADAEAREKLKLVEDEKNKMAEEYESRLKDLEQAFKKKDEETKQKAYLDKLKSDIKLKKAENNFKLREQRIKEFEKESSEKQKIGVMLRKELKNNLNISNLEMDKKLLEVASKIRKEYEEEQEEQLRLARAKASELEEKNAELQSQEEVVEEEEKPKTTKKSTTRTTAKKKTTRRSHSHTRTARRKIDSDIIGGINFD